MHRIQYFCSCAFCFCALLIVAGCGSNPSPPTVSTSVTEPSVYVLGGTNIKVPTVLVFPQTATGQTKPTLELEGEQVSVDGAGHVYMLVGATINEYSVNALNEPLRSLSVGPGTAVTTVEDATASSTGEIFVSDGTGIAVFSPTATGNATPSRYILGPSQPAGETKPAFKPGLIAVDGSDNTYVQNTSDSTIVIFGPTATGNTAPIRKISGPLTRVSGGWITGMTTDSAGNLYVLCLCIGTDGTGRFDFGVFEFDPTANGNVAPIRFVTSPEMYPYFFNDGVSVSTDGNIWVSAGTPQGGPTVFEFSSSSSGSVTPSRTVTLDGWTNAEPSRIAVH